MSGANRLRVVRELSDNRHVDVQGQQDRAAGTRDRQTIQVGNGATLISNGDTPTGFLAAYYPNSEGYLRITPGLRRLSVCLSGRNGDRHWRGSYPSIKFLPPNLAGPRSED
jgi:hypothetical protein